MNGDDGMRIIRRGRPKKPVGRPQSLLQTAPGAVVFIAVRVAAHFGGAGGGPRTDVLCRPYVLDKQEELYTCGDLYIPRANLVPIYLVDDEV